MFYILKYIKTSPSAQKREKSVSLARLFLPNGPLGLALVKSQRLAKATHIVFNIFHEIVPQYLNHNCLRVSDELYRKESTLAILCGIN